jgi:CHAD domain-containing protein
MTGPRSPRAAAVNLRSPIGVVFPPLARVLMAEAREASTVILSDDEAVHRLRVALRKLRTVLRAFREVYGPFWVEAVREGLRAAADAAGGVRDEEVFLQRVRGVELVGREAMARDRWVARRETALVRERGLLVRRFEAGLLDEPLQRLEALFVLPIVPGRDAEAGAFVLGASGRAEKTVEQRRDLARLAFLAHRDEPTAESHGHLSEALHALRIGYKRVRYTHEIFAKLLPAEAAARGKEAKKLQGWLGDVHDVDVARPKLAAATTCPAVVRRTVLNELETLAVERLDKLVAVYGWGPTAAVPTSAASVAARASQG